MTSPRSAYVNSAGYEIHVTEWGDPGKPALVMWHGLARTGRDFDEAAEALSDTYFVLCPDTIGRGLSAWAKKGSDDYCFEVYGATATGLLDHYGIERLRWVGTSMGGLIGVTLAAGALKGRMTHLVVNDIGPEIPQDAATRIAHYVGNPPLVKTVAELGAWYRTSYAPFGQNTDAFWQRLVDTSVRRTDAGLVTAHYDPEIASQFTRHKSDLDAWASYDAIAARTMVLRGADSDVLPKAVAREMLTRGPKPRLEEFDGFGHAPTLASAKEIAVLREFLAG